MLLVLVRKLLRDLRVGLLVVCLLLGGFQFLWGKVTQQSIAVTGKLRQEVLILRKFFLQTEAGQLVQKLIGGDQIDFGQAQDALSIAYVHPLVQTIPLLCLSMWTGTCLGVLTFGLGELTADIPSPADALGFAPALANVAALLFAVTGYTMWLSACGRWRTRVMGIAVLLTLLQFLVNVIAQVWKAIEVSRPFTVFFYYQPQPLILGRAEPAEVLRNLGSLFLIGAAGYLLALWTFCRRDLPAPL